MKIKKIEDLVPTDKILLDLRLEGVGLMAVKIERIKPFENEVIGEGGLDIYPDENDLYVVLEELKKNEKL